MIKLPIQEQKTLIEMHSILFKIISQFNFFDYKNDDPII